MNGPVDFVVPDEGFEIRTERGRRCYRVRVRRRTEVFLQSVLVRDRLDTWGQAAEHLLAEAALLDLLGFRVLVDPALAVRRAGGGTGKGTFSLSRTIFVRLSPPVERWLRRHHADPAVASAAYLEHLRLAGGFL